MRFRGLPGRPVLLWKFYRRGGAARRPFLRFFPGRQGRPKDGPYGCGVFPETPSVGAVLRAALLCVPHPTPGPPEGRPLRRAVHAWNPTVGAVLRAALFLRPFSYTRAARRTAPTGAVHSRKPHRRGGAARRPFVRSTSYARAARRTAPTGYPGTAHQAPRCFPEPAAPVGSVTQPYRGFRHCTHFL